MNFLIYYGIGLAYVTGTILFVTIFTTYFDDIGIKSWSTEWIGAIIATLLLPLVWPILMLNYIVRILYYIIKNKKS